jgi:hypothetical protein
MHLRPSLTAACRYQHQTRHRQHHLTRFHPKPSTHFHPKATATTDTPINHEIASNRVTGIKNENNFHALRASDAKGSASAMLTDPVPKNHPPRR